MEPTTKLNEAPIIAPDYPEPRVPTHPVLTSLLPLRTRGVPSVLDAGHAEHTVSGRMALALALERLGIGKGARVLVPGYHCLALVEPIVRVGAIPVFYRVRPDLSVDLDDLRLRADGARALVAVHYFGFPQAMAALRRFSDERGILLLEDCAHAFFGRFDGRPVGSTGDVAFASTWKFFPVQEGGCLVTRAGAKGRPLRGPGPAYEAKSMLNALERAWAAGRLPVLRALTWPLFRLKDLLRDLRKRKSATPAASTDVPTGGLEFDERWVGRRASRFTRLVLFAADFGRIARLRRRNYELLQKGFQGLPQTKILFPSLPEGVVPYVFPLLVEDEGVFPALKRKGVPIIRFGEFLWAGVDDPVALRYSRKVLQFPCHQAMKQGDLRWIISEVRDAVLKGVPG